MHSYVMRNKHRQKRKKKIFKFRHMLYHAQTSNSNPSSPPNTITLLLLALIFRPLLLPISTTCPLGLPLMTNYTKLSHLHKKGQAISYFPPHIYFHLFHRWIHIYTLESQREHDTPCLTPLLILTHSL